MGIKSKILNRKTVIKYADLNIFDKFIHFILLINFNYRLHEIDGAFRLRLETFIFQTCSITTLLTFWY